MFGARLVRKTLSFLIFRILPAILLITILWFGRGIVQAVVRQLDEKSAIESIQAGFEGTATAIVIQPSATQTTVPTATNTDMPPTETSTALPPTATETALPTATNTDIPTDVPPTATNTDVPPTNTSQPTATNTEVPPTFTSTSSPLAAQSAAQLAATNTSIPFTFATNTPAGGSLGGGTGGLFQTSTPNIPAATITPVLPTATTIPPTNTAIPPTETPLPPPTQMVAATTRPLPTPLFPREAQEGTMIDGLPAPTSVPLVPRNHDLVNILLLGGDSEITNDGTVRTDTMIVVSINRDTGTVSMMSLPRDLYVFIPAYTASNPDGMMYRLNVVYGLGENLGWTDGGFGLLRQTILYNFGINVHYYASVDFSGFKQLIDTLGGVNIAVDCAYQDYGLIGAEVPEGAIETGEDGDQFILNVGYYDMNGAQALWYARTRGNSTDFDRGRRQQQLLRAIWRKSLSQVSLTNAPGLWNQGMGMIKTDMGLDDFLGLLPLALNLDVSGIKNYTLIHTYHTQPWTSSDGSSVQLPVYETMRPLLEDFYRPPSEAQLTASGASIAVYNGTGNTYWDQVAAERLAWEGFNAFAAGAADSTDYSDTILIDYTGQQKDNSLNVIASALNVHPNNVRIEPNPNRTADFAVYLGSTYNSCPGGVTEIEDAQ